MFLASFFVLCTAATLAIAGTPPRRPHDFGFRLADGDGNCIDSDSGLVTKDLISGPDTTIAFRFTTTEMDTIWATMIRLRVFELPEPHPAFGPPPGVVQTVSISTTHVFAIHGGGRRRTFEWTDAQRDPSHRSPEIERFWQAMHVIERIVAARPEYAALPRPRGPHY